ALSLALTVGCQFSLIAVAPLSLAFMLYLAPGRRRAALAIWATAAGIAALLLYGAYFFRAAAFWQGIRHADFLPVTWPALGMAGVYQRVGGQITKGSPVLLLALPAALFSYLAWPRVRYFGNTAPLLVAGLFLFLAIATPHYPGLGFQLMAMPF